LPEYEEIAILLKTFGVSGRAVTYIWTSTGASTPQFFCAASAGGLAIGKKFDRELLKKV
jgi:hypothetical protein